MQDLCLELSMRSSSVNQIRTDTRYKERCDLGNAKLQKELHTKNKHSILQNYYRSNTHDKKEITLMPLAYKGTND